MSFSNNSSRTVLKTNAYGEKLTLTTQLDTPLIYLNGQNLNTLLSTPKTTTTATSLSTNCTGTNLSLSNKLTAGEVQATTGKITGNLTAINAGIVTLTVSDAVITENIYIAHNLVGKSVVCASISATGTINCDSISATNISTTNLNTTVTNTTTTSLTSSTINQSRFLSFKGYTYYDSSADFNMYRFYYIKYDGNVSVQQVATIDVNANCYHVKIVFTYSTTSFYTPNINGSKEYIFIKTASNNLFENMYSSYSVGRESYQPTFEVTTANRIDIVWPYNGLDDNLGEYLYWNCAVFIN